MTADWKNRLSEAFDYSERMGEGSNEASIVAHDLLSQLEAGKVQVIELPAPEPFENLSPDSYVVEVYCQRHEAWVWHVSGTLQDCLSALLNLQAHPLDSTQQALRLTWRGHS